MDIQTRIQVERRIIRNAICELIEGGYGVSTFADNVSITISGPSDRLDRFVDFLMDEDAPSISVMQGETRLGLVEFSLGESGWNVLADRSPSLDDALKETIRLSESMRMAERDGTLWQFIDVERFEEELRHHADYDCVTVSWVSFDGEDDWTGDLISVRQALDDSGPMVTIRGHDADQQVRHNTFQFHTYQPQQERGFLKVLTGPLAGITTDVDDDCGPR